MSGYVVAQAEHELKTVPIWTGGWIARKSRGLLRFCAAWTGRAIRFGKRIRPVPIFWGSLYWICFGLVLVRGYFRRAFVKGSW